MQPQFENHIFHNKIHRDQSAIVLLGECNLVCITDNGTVRFIKRLDYTPICFESFLNGEPTGKIAIYQTINVTFSNNIQ